MIDKLFMYAVLLGFTWLAISNGSKLNSNEIEARQFALETSDRLFKFLDTLRDEIFNDDEDYILNRSQIILNATMFLKELVRDAKKFDFKNFKDKELKYAFEQIPNIADEGIIGGQQYNEILDSLDQLEELWVEKRFLYFEECDDIESSLTAMDIPEIVETSNSSEEIQYYWEKLRETSGKWAMENLNLTLNGLKDAANLLDMSPLEFWLREYNLTEMENLMSEIQPLYMELHAFIRKGLQNKYGDSTIRSDGLIPHHLFEQVMAQAWKNGSIIEELFPYAKLPPVESVMKKRFKTLELYEIADRFYQKLGFTEFPNQVWKDHIKMKKLSDENTGGCSPVIFYLSPNIHLEFCEIMNFEEFLQVYSDIGKLYYAKEMSSLPAYFFATHDLEYAIGKAAILSASTHHNLKAIGMILEFDFTEEVEMNRLLRTSIKSLLNLSVDFVHIKLMADLLSGNVELKELNDKYWEHMDNYLGVGPPMSYKTAPDVLDVPFSFYIDVNDNEQSRKFDSEILSYQIYKKLCELGGKYPKEPLHLCDIHGTKAAGDVLKNMMRLGISKPFNEVLGTMFPENQNTSTEGILEYYSPVKNLLVKKNLEANVETGWKHSDKNSSDNSNSDKPYKCKSKPSI